MDLEPHPNDEPTDDPLDGLLRHASPSVPDAAAVGRLERYWERVRPQRRLRPVWIGAAAAAALVGIALFVWSYRSGHVPPTNDVAKQKSDDSVDREPNRSPVEPLKVREPPLAPELVDGRRATESDPARDTRPVDSYKGRAPTAYEQVVLHALENRSQGVHRTVDVALLHRTIVQLATDPNADAAALADPLRNQSAAYAQRLARVAHHNRGPRRVAAVRLLGELGDERSAAVLVRLCRHRGTRDVVLRSLVRIASPETIARLAIAEPNAEVRERLALALLDRRDDRSVAAYLTLIGSTATTDDALRALRQIDDPPVDQFFDHVASAETNIRTSAAIALGQVNGPATTDRLIQMVLDENNADSAMLALMLCRSSNAQRFLHHAARDRSLIAAVNLARCQVQLLFN